MECNPIEATTLLNEDGATNSKPKMLVLKIAV
jgi:hypothetical protein